MIWKILTLFNLAVSIGLMGLIGMAVHNIKKKKKNLRNASTTKTYSKR